MHSIYKKILSIPILTEPEKLLVNNFFKYKNSGSFQENTSHFPDQKILYYLKQRRLLIHEIEKFQKEITATWIKIHGVTAMGGDELLPIIISLLPTEEVLTPNKPEDLASNKKIEEIPKENEDLLNLFRIAQQENETSASNDSLYLYFMATFTSALMYRLANPSAVEDNFKILLVAKEMAIQDEDIPYKNQLQEIKAIFEQYKVTLFTELKNKLSWMALCYYFDTTKTEDMEVSINDIIEEYDNGTSLVSLNKDVMNTFKEKYYAIVDIFTTLNRQNKTTKEILNEFFQKLELYKSILFTNNNQHRNRFFSAASNYIFDTKISRLLSLHPKETKLAEGIAPLTTNAHEISALPEERPSAKLI